MSKLASFGGDCQHYGKPNDYLLSKSFKMKHYFEDWLETPKKLTGLMPSMTATDEHSQ
jgi:hypothetical protein